MHMFREALLLPTSYIVMRREAQCRALRLNTSYIVMRREAQSNTVDPDMPQPLQWFTPHPPIARAAYVPLLSIAFRRPFSFPSEERVGSPPWCRLAFTTIG